MFDLSTYRLVLSFEVSTIIGQLFTHSHAFSGKSQFYTLDLELQFHKEGDYLVLKREHVGPSYTDNLVWDLTTSTIHVMREYAAGYTGMMFYQNMDHFSANQLALEIVDMFASQLLSE